MTAPSTSNTTNGYVDAPPVLSGASVSPINRIGRTVFPPEVPIASLHATAYASRRFLLGGAPASRYLTILLVVLASVWATGLLPGRWIGVAFFSTLLLVHMFVGRWWQERDYVDFSPGQAPDVLPARLNPTDSLPVYVTGGLAVEGSVQRFTFVPGFYKTFATREHGLLCQVRPRRAFGVLRWPEAEVGMWYAFFQAERVRKVEWGRLRFSRRPMDTVAVHYEVCRPASGRFARRTVEVCSHETLYLSSEDTGGLHKIVADLLADEPVQEAMTQSV